MSRVLVLNCLIDCDDTAWADLAVVALRKKGSIVHGHTFECMECTHIWFWQDCENYSTPAEIECPTCQSIRVIITKARVVVE